MITIPPVPASIRDANDLYNGGYPGFPRLRWDNPEFQDRLLWLREHGIPQEEFRVTAYTQSGFAPTWVKWGTDPQNWEIDVWNVMRATPGLLVILRHRFDLPGANILEEYPGYDIRHPSKPKPVGAPWPDHPWQHIASKMYHSSTTDNQIDFPVGKMWEEVENGVTVRYVKVQFVTGNSFFTLPGQNTEGIAWQRVYN